VCWWHLLPIKVAFASSRDIDVELYLESTKNLDLRVIEGVDKKHSNVEKGKTNMAWWLQRVAKGVFTRKGYGYYILSYIW